MNSHIRSLAVLVLILAIAGTSGAAITVYTDLDAWRDNLGSYQTETFNDGDLDYGITVATGNGEIDNNRWSDRVVPGGSATTWTFPQLLNAWAADFWDLAGPGGPGTGIQVYLDGVAAPSEIPNSTQGTFWGAISDVPFSAVLIAAGTQSGVYETYEMDNMSFSTVVPAPGALLLAGLGTALAGWIRRTRGLA
ncbi:MAG: hypothetical protein A2Y77_09590 [Planctomycetes bacterium RBG_13_62_9]|nr:MAG: hypothetical protein A2Y77_09590 [Planctomycetes bacterium RBG_13_62_9]